MEKCFIIQPFDGGVFDNRYEDVYAPAIIDSGLEPYRVDQDLKVSIPIQEIENGIRDSRICLADISLDNPNVWFELGFAIALFKEVVLICSDQRYSKFPFDVQHRSIIRYSTGAPRDFDVLRNKITKRINALLQKAETLLAVTNSFAASKIEGLDQYEIVALAAIGENFDTNGDVVSIYQVRRDMEQYGFTKLAATMALKTLLDKGLTLSDSYSDYDGEQFIGYSLSKTGWDWIMHNKEKFILKRI